MASTKTSKRDKSIRKVGGRVQAFANGKVKAIVQKQTKIHLAQLQEQIKIMYFQKKTCFICLTLYLTIHNLAKLKRTDGPPRDT